MFAFDSFEPRRHIKDPLFEKRLESCWAKFHFKAFSLSKANGLCFPFQVYVIVGASAQQGKRSWKSIWVTCRWKAIKRKVPALFLDISIELELVEEMKKQTFALALNARIREHAALTYYHAVVIFQTAFSSDGASVCLNRQRECPPRGQPPHRSHLQLFQLLILKYLNLFNGQNLGQGPSSNIYQRMKKLLKLWFNLRSMKGNENNNKTNNGCKVRQRLTHDSP